MTAQIVRYFTASDVDKSDAKKGNIVRDIEILRTGTFRDTFGRKFSYSEGDLDEIVANFYELRQSGSFPNVPVRLNHNRDVMSVAGYITELRRVGDRLVADQEFTEPHALEMLRNGTLRERSIEAGPFKTVDGTLYKNVLLGVAWVDIGAVDKLAPVAAAKPEGEEEVEIVELNREEFTYPDDEETVETDDEFVGALDQAVERARALLPQIPDDYFTFAKWTTAYINDLPDSAFAYVAPGGKKDDEGKTVPRSLRFLPHHDANGAIDLPHLRNALARLNQADIPANTKKGILAHLRRHASAEGVGTDTKRVAASQEVDEKEVDHMQYPISDVAKFTLSDGTEITELEQIELPAPATFTMERGDIVLAFANQATMDTVAELYQELDEVREKSHEQDMAARVEFVESLRDAGKILAAPEWVEAETQLVQSMTAQQFTDYKAIKEANPALLKMGEPEGDQGQKHSAEDDPELVTLNKTLKAYSDITPRNQQQIDHLNERIKARKQELGLVKEA